MSPKHNTMRHLERQRAFEILFAHSFNETFEDTLSSLEQISPKFKVEKLSPFTLRLITTEIKNHDFIIKQIERYSKNWTMDRCGKPEFILLCLGITELFYFDDIPDPVTIDEYVEFSKKYGGVSEDAKRYINGVLDTISKQKERNA